MMPVFLFVAYTPKRAYKYIIILAYILKLVFKKEAYYYTINMRLSYAIICPFWHDPIVRSIVLTEDDTGKIGIFLQETPHILLFDRAYHISMSQHFSAFCILVICGN